MSELTVSITQADTTVTESVIVKVYAHNLGEKNMEPQPTVVEIEPGAGTDITVVSHAVTVIRLNDTDDAHMKLAYAHDPDEVTNVEPSP